MKVPVSKNTVYYVSATPYKMQKYLIITVVQEIWNSLHI